MITQLQLDYNVYNIVNDLRRLYSAAHTYLEDLSPKQKARYAYRYSTLYYARMRNSGTDIDKFDSHRAELGSFSTLETYSVTPVP